MTTHELELLGDSLQRAWRADHESGTRRTTRRRLLAVAVCALLVAAGTALAASALKTPADEERGMLNGYAIFAGTNPSCEQLTPLSYRCVLDRAPTEITFYGPDGEPLPNAYLGIKAETVNADRRVDGGCVSTSANGRAWNCYLGEEAVRRGIVSPSFLGTYLPVPPTA